MAKTDEWTIETLTADDAGFEFFLKEYKPFRLMALQQDPDAFGSNHAREVGFAEDEWRKRLYNPLAKTFAVVSSRDRRILSSTTLVGPMPSQEPTAQPLQLTQSQHSTSTVYTRAEYRGRRLGRALMKVAIEYAQQEAQPQHTNAKISVVVYASNQVGRLFYERCGFKVANTAASSQESDQFSSSRPVLCMFYVEPTSTSS